MKKLLAILCACLCFCLAVTAYAEPEDATDTAVNEVVSSEDVDTPVVGDVAVGEPTFEDTVVSEPETLPAVGDTTTIGATTPTASGDYNVVEPEHVIVNYASSEEELPHIGILVWSVCGVLLAGVLAIFVTKFVKWRQSK